MPPKTSLIIATYNQPEFLRLAILSAWEQTHLPDEIIIADDGSREETAELVREMKKVSSVPIIHTWQPDNGFRVMLARNNAVAVSTGEYLIFLDGDCYLTNTSSKTIFRMPKRDISFAAGGSIFVQNGKNTFFGREIDG